MNHIREKELNDYVDGELSESRTQEVDRHLEECDECRKALQAVSALVAELGELPQHARPDRDLWEDISRATVHRDKVTPIATRRRAGWSRLSISLPQAAAAAVAAALLAAGGVWLALSGGNEAGSIAGREASVAEFVNNPVGLMPYDEVVAELTYTLNEQRADLDTATARVIKENLEIIDAAIEEINEALSHDPSSEFLNSYLARTLRRKVEVLKRASDLVSRT